MANDETRSSKKDNSISGSEGISEATMNNNDPTSTKTDDINPSKCDSGKPDDPVDLCQIHNGDIKSDSNQMPNHKQNLFSYGDYKNIRATGNATSEGSIAAPADLLQNQPVPAPINHVPPPQNPFSFKHFLNRDPPSSSAAIITSINTNVASSTTAATADSSQCENQQKIEGTSASNLANATIVVSTSTTVISTSTCSSSSYQTSTGARPKVPLSSSSVSSTSISSLLVNSKGLSNTVTGASGTELPCSSSKMKRSPRFSSFDSQASLAEYAEAAGGVTASSSIVIGSCKNGLNSGFRLHPESSDLMSSSDRDDIFTRTENRNLSSKGSTACNSNEGDYDRYFVPRSYSNYDMHVPPSPRRRAGVVNSNSENRPNRLSGIQPQGAKLKGHTLGNNAREQPLDTYFMNEFAAKTSHGTGSVASGNINNNCLLSNSDFGGTSGVASVLPDFVQDHLVDLIDSWYPNDMNLSSPQNSPTGFVEDLPAGCGSGGKNVSHCQQPSSGDKCQTLPDFLSDGPIIHSSQRLADVAAGLPNLDSPDDNSPSLQLSRLRLENERLCRELNETRITLGEQIRQCNELERTLEQTHKMESAYNRTLAQNIGLVEENLDQSKKRNAAAHCQIAKLKQQVKQLTSEVEILKRENDVLREEGAVGGSNTTLPAGPGSSVRDRGAASSCSLGGASAASTTSRRPSTTQQISKDLLKAASNAENNLRQLLAGVDNLRQMAADIENAEHVDYDNSPDLFSEFLDDCDDFDEFTGGPAL